MASKPALGLMPVLLFCVLAFMSLRGLTQPFGNGDEIIYAENVREMQASGDWGVLSWQGVQTMQRPPLPFVLSMWSASLLPGELGLRLPMALFSLLTLALVYLACFKAWRRHDAACLASLLCASVPTVHLFGRALLSDAPLLAMTTLALLGTLWSLRDARGILVAGFGLGAAFAVKSLAAGPITLALAPWLLYSTIHHRAYKKLVWASAIFAALALPYFVYSYLRFGSEFLEQHVGWTLARRIDGGYGETVGLPGGLWAYAAHLWRADGPWVVAWLSLAAGSGLWLWRRGDAIAGCAASTGLALLVLFSLSGTRLPHYILGIYPALAIALAGAYVALIERVAKLQEALPRVLLATIAASGALLGITRPVPTNYLLPSPAALAIGERIAELGDTRPLYTLDWYAPACAYYANKPWLALFSSEHLVEQLNTGIRFFQAARNIRTAPPWPRGSYLLAGPWQSIQSTSLAVQEVLVEWGDFRLVSVVQP